jgi:hypothetical protein
MSLSEVDVIVRADGGTGLPPIAPRQLIARPDAPPLALIDLDDRHHPVPRRNARARRNAYATRGWFAPGADPVVARAARFLETRPGAEDPGHEFLATRVGVLARAARPVGPLRE